MSVSRFFVRQWRRTITRSVEALEGAPNVIFHLYNSTSELQRRVVFVMDRQGIIDLAVQGTELVKQGLDGFASNVTFEYSPESFTGTELDFASEICTAVADTGAQPGGANDYQSTKHGGDGDTKYLRRSD